MVRVLIVAVIVAVGMNLTHKVADHTMMMISGLLKCVAPVMEEEQKHMNLSLTKNSKK